MRRAAVLLIGTLMAALLHGCKGEAIMATVPWLSCWEYPRAQIDTIGWIRTRADTLAPITTCVLDPRIIINP